MMGRKKMSGLICFGEEEGKRKWEGYRLHGVWRKGILGILIFLKKICAVLE